MDFSINKLSLGTPILDANYLKFKQAELNCLARLAKGQKSLLSHQSTFLDLLNTKLNLKKAIRLLQLEGENILTSESNLVGLSQEIKVGALKFRYAYQRSGLDISNSIILKNWYGALKKIRSDVVYQSFLSSCQAGLSAFFFASAQLTQDFNIEFATDDTYWETLLFLKKSKFQRAGSSKPKPASVRILLVDSSALPVQSMHKIRAKILKSHIVLIDSTCFESNSQDLKAIAKWCEEARAPFVIFRSHNKLDCLGIEYDRLGSVVILTPKMCSKKIKSLVAEIIGHFKLYCRLFGAFAQIHQIYPFYFDKTFERLNLKRIARQKNANAWVFANLQEALGQKAATNVRLKQFNHDLFFLICFSQAFAEKQLSLVAKRLWQHFLSRGIPHMISASYPWDFTAITVFTTNQELDSEKKQTVFRISVGDYGRQIQKLTVAALKDWLTELDDRGPA